MRFTDLVEYIAEHTPFEVMDGDVNATLAKARAGEHRDRHMGEILRQLYERSGCKNPDDSIERATAVHALGPLRLVYMKDDAPVEAFRMVEKTIHAIDGAFNDEALREKFRK